jgi:hypothetical protein
MTRGSGSADPDVRTAINLLMTRGSGSADPGVGIAKILLHDDARIRGVRIRASEPVTNFFSMMTRGSGEYGSGLQFVI